MTQEHLNHVVMLHGHRVTRILLIDSLIEIARSLAGANERRLKWQIVFLAGHGIDI